MNKSQDYSLKWQRIQISLHLFVFLIIISSGFVYSQTPPATIVPIASWPVGNPTEYGNPPTLYWYMETFIAGLTFELQCVPAADPWPADNIVASTSEKSFKIPYTLSAGVKYAWRVRSVNGTAKSAWCATQYFTMVDNTPAGPVVPIASWPVGNPTEYNTMPTFNWYFDTYAPGLTYEIQCVPAADPWPADNIVAVSSVTNFKMPYALKNGIKYAWRVRSTNGKDKSAWCAAQFFTIVSSPKTDPVVPVPSWPVDNPTEYNPMPTFNWYIENFVPGLTYEIQCVPAADSWPSDDNYAVSSTMSFKLPYALQYGVQYAWRVRSSNGTTKSSWSATAYFTMVGKTTEGPIRPIASWPVDNTIEYNSMPSLYWYLGADGKGLTYEIQCVPAADPWPADNVVAVSDKMSFMMPYELKSGVQYAWRVRSTNGKDKSAWSQYALFTMAQNIPGSTIVPIASWPVGNSTEYNMAPTLSWYLGAPGTGLTYEIQCVPAADPWPADNVVAVSDKMSFMMPYELKSGVQYAWRVRSTNGKDKSAWSQYALFTMAAPNSSVQPVAISPSKQVTVNTNAPELFWFLPTASKAITSYEVRISDNADFTKSKSVISEKSKIQVSGLESGKTYYWQVRSLDASGKPSDYSGIGEFMTANSTTAVNEKKNTPSSFKLDQNFPNPFNPSTVINYSIPVSGMYMLKVYDMLGREVAILAKGEINAGNYSTVFNAAGLPSGIYFYQLSGNNVNLTMKMQLLK